MADFPGTATDQIPAVGQIGGCVVRTMMTAMTERHPDGDDADFLRWHTFDHRPEHHRNEHLRCSLRAVSTPRCRAHRAVSTPALDAVDHVMSYLWSDYDAGHAGMSGIVAAFKDHGRMRQIPPMVTIGTTTLEGRVSSSRINTSADVLPWRPMTGVYLLVEQGGASPAPLVDVAGVTGAWWGPGAPGFGDFGADQQLTYLFLDDDPVAVAQRLAGPLAQRWEATGVTPLLAAPFHDVIGNDIERHLP
jgi:hypothetical protein